MRLSLSLFALATMLAPIAAPALAAPTDVTVAQYRCDRGAVVLATYVNAGEDAFAVVGFEGRQLGFVIATSASGARFVSTDPTQPYVWWTKGETAMLLHGSGDAEVMVYGDCAEVK